jgi:hypothetical protein
LEERAGVVRRGDLDNGVVGIPVVEADERRQRDLVGPVPKVESVAAAKLAVLVVLFTSSGIWIINQ